MAYSPIMKKPDNQIMKGIARLKTLKKEEEKLEKRVSNDSLNNIELNIKNFISKALVNNSNETKYFNINQELEEIEKAKKNQLKEEETFTKLRAKYPIGDQILTYDDINTSNLIGLNRFKQKRKRFSSNNICFNQSFNTPNHYSPKKHTLDYTEKKNLESFVKVKVKKRNSVQLKFDDNINYKNNISNNHLDYTSPKNKFSITNIYSKDDYLPIIDKDLKNIKKKQLIKYSSVSKIRSPIKKLSQNFLQWRKKKGKQKEKPKIIRKQREKTQVVNKKNLYQRLMNLNYKNEKRRLYNSTITGFNNNINNIKVIKTKTFNSKSNVFKDIRKSSEIKDKNDIRNIINISENQYNEFSKYCSQIKEKLLFSPKKSIKKNPTLSSQKKIEKILNENNEKNEQKNTNILTFIEKKNYLEEGFQENELGSNRVDIKKFKEIQYRHLVRLNKLVYDSLSDEESDEEFDDSFYINPKSKFKFYFDLIIFILTWYNMIIPPIFICFYPQKSNFYNFMNIITNCFFMSDLLLGFITAYYDIEEKFIWKLPDIIFNYLTTWFIPDLLCAFPFSFFSEKPEKIISTNEFELKYLLDLFNLIKVFKIYNNNTFFFQYNNYIIKKTNLLKFSETSRFIYLFILCGHILACIFIFLSHLENPSWVTHQNLMNNSKLEIYISSFYYVYATVFTVGYGDIVSINIYERFFNLILLVAGIMAYSYSVSSLSNYVQNVDSKTQDFNDKMEILHHLKLTHEKMPKALYDKIARFLKYRLEHVVRDKNEIMDNLPIGLRTTLIMEMYKPIIKNFIFFKTYSSSNFIIKVILAFRPLLVMKNEKLVNEGDYLEEIIFVKRGTLALELPLPVLIKDKDIEDINIKRRRASLLNMEFPQYPINKSLSNQKPRIIDFNNETVPQKTMTFVRGKGLTFNHTFGKKNNNNNNKIDKPIQQYVKIIEIRKNEHFGDILMFLNRRSPLSMKVKSKTAELFLLNKTDAVEISMSFPKIWSLIIKKSLFNMEQIERLINKTLFFFFHQNKNKEYRGSYYQKDISKQNIFVNCDELYPSLSSQDCELQSIPSVSENVNDSDKTIIKSKRKTNSNDKSENDTSINNSFYDYENGSKSIRSYSSKNSNEPLKGNNQYLNINTNNNDNINNKSSFTDILNNEIINEVNSDDEKDSVFQKKSKKKFGKDTERKNTPSKKPNNESNEISFSQSDESSSSFENKSKTLSKTLKGKDENNYFINLSTFSDNNYNTLFYPYSKDEINNEELPFENYSLNYLLGINSFDKNFNGIVPKEYLNENNNNKFSSIKPKIIFRENGFFNLLTSKFYFQINSIKEKKNTGLSIISHSKEYKIINIESFTLDNNKNKNNNNNNDKVKLTAVSEKTNKITPLLKVEKEKNESKENVNRTKSNINFQRKSTINRTVKEKNYDKRISKKMNNIKINNKFMESEKKIDSKNEKKNKPLFSEGTLNLIGKNIESSSLALNNPQLFYRNYFNKVVSDDNHEKKKNFSSKLKEIEKIIHSQKSRRDTKDTFDINISNNLNNNDKTKNNDNSDKRSL